MPIFPLNLVEKLNLSICDGKCFLRRASEEWDLCANRSSDAGSDVVASEERLLCGNHSFDAGSNVSSPAPDVAFVMTCGRPCASAAVVFCGRVLAALLSAPVTQAILTDFSHSLKRFV